LTKVSILLKKELPFANNAMDMKKWYFGISFVKLRIQKTPYEKHLF